MNRGSKDGMYGPNDIRKDGLLKAKKLRERDALVKAARQKENGYKDKGFIGIRTWFCHSCMLEIPEGCRCECCGKTRKEKK